MKQPTDSVRIWSNKRQAWWKGEAMGYTTDIKEAGVFFRSNAMILLAHSTTSEIKEIYPDTPSLEKRSLEAHYQQYLKLVNLKEETMHPVQRIETKRAFYGAAGILLAYFKELPERGEDESIQALMIMENQVADFWEGQKIKFP